METLESGTFVQGHMQTGVEQKAIEGVFEEICGNYPGAATVRKSHKLFKELVDIEDEEELADIKGEEEQVHAVVQSLNDLGTFSSFARCGRLLQIYIYIYILVIKTDSLPREDPRPLFSSRLAIEPSIRAASHHSNEYDGNSRSSDWWETSNPAESTSQSKFPIFIPLMRQVSRSHIDEHNDLGQKAHSPMLYSPAIPYRSPSPSPLPFPPDSGGLSPGSYSPGPEGIGAEREDISPTQSIDRRRGCPRGSLQSLPQPPGSIKPPSSGHIQRAKHPENTAKGICILSFGMFLITDP
jgi:hypothetical protein